MGMLMARHRRQGGDTPAPAKPARKRQRGKAKDATETPQGPVAPVGPAAPEAYAELSEDQVLEAYTFSIPEGEATTREDMVAELQALDVEDDTTDE